MSVPRWIEIATIKTDPQNQHLARPLWRALNADVKPMLRPGRQVTFTLAVPAVSDSAATPKKRSPPYVRQREGGLLWGGKNHTPVLVIRGLQLHAPPRKVAVSAASQVLGNLSLSAPLKWEISLIMEKHAQKKTPLNAGHFLLSMLPPFFLLRAGESFSSCFNSD